MRRRRKGKYVTAKRVLEHLQLHPEQGTTAEIATALDISRQAVGKHIQRLKQGGELSQRFYVHRQHRPFCFRFMIGIKVNADWLHRGTSDAIKTLAEHLVWEFPSQLDGLRDRLLIEEVMVLSMGEDDIIMRVATRETGAEDTIGEFLTGYLQAHPAIYKTRLMSVINSASLTEGRR